MVLTFESGDETLNVAIQIEADKQYFPFSGTVFFTGHRAIQCDVSDESTVCFFMECTA